MRRLLSFLFILTLDFILLSFPFAGEGGAGPRLIKKWETKNELKVCESVLYDKDRNILYVSCINGKPTEKNEKGFIAKVTLEGKIEELKWAAGLNAPKGMGIYGSSLYVADIDRLVEIDLKSGKIVSQYLAAGAIFLNDVAVDTLGNVYVSDSSAENSAIYRLTRMKFREWLRTDEIVQPNGLYAEKDRLLVGSFQDGSLKAVNLENKKISLIANAGHVIDGIGSDGKGNYLVSDWSGKTSLITISCKVLGLLDTTASRINSADIEFIPDKNLLLIPTFFDNRVMAYELKID
jgi:sugar lactone lactonase YvrE